MFIFIGNLPGKACDYPLLPFFYVKGLSTVPHKTACVDFLHTALQPNIVSSTRYSSSSAYLAQHSPRCGVMAVADLPAIPGAPFFKNARSAIGLFVKQIDYQPL
jgi:hypothetical protein